jgi:hypothetical protein
MTAATCRCGARWHQAGNRTGHCAACHRTFSGLSTFDEHQRIEDGITVCLDPATITTSGVCGDGARRRFTTYVDREGAEVWKRADAPTPARSDDAPDGAAA